MKTERRHELKSNELDHLLVEVSTFFKKHGPLVLGSLAAVVLLFVGITYFRHNADTTLRQAYDQLHALEYTTDEQAAEALLKIQQLVDGAGDKVFRLEALNYQASLASSRMVDPTTGQIKKNFADDAQRAFERILRDYADNAAACGSALSGLATVEETLFLLDRDTGRKAKAQAHLMRIIEDARLNATPLAVLAADRKNRLEETFTPVEMDETPLPTSQPSPPTSAPAVVSPPTSANVAPPASQPAAG